MDTSGGPAPPLTRPVTPDNPPTPFDHSETPRAPAPPLATPVPRPRNAFFPQLAEGFAGSSPDPLQQSVPPLMRHPRPSGLPHTLFLSNFPLFNTTACEAGMCFFRYSTVLRGRLSPLSLFSFKIRLFIEVAFQCSQASRPSL